MPYKTPKNLPKSVREHLPSGAQKIFLEAYNSAFKQYKDPSKRRGSATRSETASRVAWNAVKKKYHKDSSGKWKRD